MSAAPAASRAAITLLACAAFFSGAALRVCDGLVPRLVQDFGVTPGTAGSIIISFSVAYGLMQLVFGPLGDRFGKARMVTVAVASCAVAACASALAPGFDALVGIRVFWGMAAAGIIPLAMAWIGDAVPFEERQPTLSRLLLGTLSGMMAGQLAGGLFADSAAGWRGAFFTLGGGYAIVAVLLYRLLPRPPVAPRTAGSQGFLSGVREVVGSSWARQVLLAAFLEGVFLLALLAYLPDYLHRRFGLAVSAATALLALFAVGGLVYAMTARRIVQRFGQPRMVLVGGWIMGAGCLLWLVAPWAAAAAPIALAVGFGTYLYHNTLQTFATQMVPQARGSAVSVFAFSLFTGQAVGVTLYGWAYDHGGAGWILLPSAVALPLTAWKFSAALRRRTQTT